RDGSGALETDMMEQLVGEARDHPLGEVYAALSERWLPLQSVLVNSRDHPDSV
ncbi:unnamed protein product, partial [Symbiodinium pilosum]